MLTIPEFGQVGSRGWSDGKREGENNPGAMPLLTINRLVAQQ
jgi:hypothetical protein